MNKSGRRVLRATAAVAGITALGAVGSGIAFADNVTGHDATDSYGETDLTGGESGLPTDALETVDLYSFEMPSLGDSSVKGRSSGHNAETSENTASEGTESKASKKKDSDDEGSKSKDSDDEESDDGGSGDKDFEDGGSDDAAGGLLGGLL